LGRLGDFDDGWPRKTPGQPTSPAICGRTRRACLFAVAAQTCFERGLRGDARSRGRMDELDHPVLNQKLAAIEKAMTNAYPADPIRYAKLFKLHNRLQRRAQWVDAGSSLTRAVGEHADVRRRAVASS